MHIGSWFEPFTGKDSTRAARFAMEAMLQDVSKAVAAIGRIDAVPTLLAVLREITGMRFAAVARVTEKVWTVCAVQDGLHLGIEAGAPFVLRTNPAFQSQSTRAPIIVEQAAPMKSHVFGTVQIGNFPY